MSQASVFSAPAMQQQQHGSAPPRRFNPALKPSRSAALGKAVKALAFTRTATPAKPTEPETPGLLWFPWNRLTAERPAAEQASQQEAAGFFAPLLSSGTSSSGSTAPQEQQQPAPSRRGGTQLIMPWSRSMDEAPSDEPSPGRAPAKQAGSAKQATSFPYWRLAGSGTTAVAEVAEPAPARQPAGPILSCAGGGVYFFWMLGVVKYLMANFDLSKVQMNGASAGGLVIALAACGVNPDRAIRVAYRLAVENDIWGRTGGLAGIWGSLVRQWLNELLPEDAAQRCNGHVKLVVTEVPSLQLQYVSDFKDKADLVDALMASAHIPFLLDGNATCAFRGKKYIDGSLYDFIFGNNSHLLTCDGDACVIDYFNDDQLQYSRLDFVKLADIEWVLSLEKAGYDYADRVDRRGDFEQWLGPVRKGVMVRVLEYPVRQMARVFA